MNEACRRALEAGIRRGETLELAPPGRAGGFTGRRLGSRSGNALEFAEYREYQAGDDLRRLDWSVYARSEQLMTRLFREEIDPRCDLILDTSASMAAPGTEKAEAMLALAALLAQAAVNAGFSLEVWRAGDSVEREAAPRNPLEWSIGDFTHARSPGESLPAFAGGFQRRGLRIAISDLLWPEAPGPFLTRLAEGAMVAIVIRLGDDAHPPEAGGITLLTDAETGEERELILDDVLIARYRERLHSHRALWEREAGEHGVRLFTLGAEEAYPGWRLDELFQAEVLR